MTVHVGRVNIVVKHLGLTKSQWVATIAGLVNLGMELPSVIPVLVHYGFHPTEREKGVVAIISWGSAYIARSVLKSRSGIPGEDPNVPVSAEVENKEIV